MNGNYEALGQYIRAIDVRNRDLAIDYLLGLSINKKFIPSIANTVGTEFDSYKVVRTGQFAYGPVTSRNGDKITIALLDDKDCIISSSYSVFEVVDKKKLLPEYLMLWFKRSEFDRYARYKSHGSVREIFGWDELCNTKLPVPSLDKQRAVVKAYQTITDRIALKRAINDNLSYSLRCQLRKKCLLEFKHFFLFLLVFSDLLYRRLRERNEGIKIFLTGKHKFIQEDVYFVTTRHFSSSRSRHNIVEKAILRQGTV